jgi:hypothetical protein
LNEVVELERQSMLWSKKLELEKETQAALDPEAGMAECRDMEREIHRYHSPTAHTTHTER